ncbi:hypothetical protein Mal48_00070 [Thalassoglobus polymorphus]|uniref:Lipoprotein n=1 Tax=Thalassoglobus polymorphus TaxID=2527994 RepID=A0A517QGM4_9PLAN|nr:hypothetical protein Mal48_00070 [Thalassoglobus polymorphus]
MRRYFMISLSLCCLASGCQMMEWVQPHQLWKLNRQPAISRDDAYFNVPAQPVPNQSSAIPAATKVRAF